MTIGVVHRDLKPENLLLSDPTDAAILKIADFGLSAVVFATENSGSRESSALGMTPFRNNNVGNNNQREREDSICETEEPALLSVLQQAQTGCVQRQYAYNQRTEVVGAAADRHTKAPLPVPAPRSIQQLVQGTSAVEQKEREFWEREHGRSSTAVSSPTDSSSNARTHRQQHPALGQRQSAEVPCAPVQILQRDHTDSIQITAPPTQNSYDNNTVVPCNSEQLGPPLAEAESSPSPSLQQGQPQQQQSVRSPVAQGSEPLSPGLTNAVPMRRLRSVVGSPHYIAPEIASNGTSSLLHLLSIFNFSYFVS